MSQSPENHLPENRLPETTAAAVAPMEMAALQRRRALLAGLGKGSAALAALVPLAGQASSRDRVVFNAALNGNGYCSVSGFQSAAISSAPGATACSASRPADFFVATDGTYMKVGTSNTARRDGILAALRAAPFSIPASVEITNGQANALKPLGGTATIDGKVYVAVGRTTDGGTLRELQATANFPTISGIYPTMAFNSADFIGAGPSTSVLEALASNTSNAYFAAAFLTCVIEDGSVMSPGGFDAGSLPFDAAYVRDQYKNNQIDAAVFFKAISPPP
jgi:hypothetical protein